MAPRKESRAFWSGTISFGLVSVPVELFSAATSRPRGLRMVAADGTPLERRYYCTADGEEVAWDQLTRGYEIGDEEYVEVTEEELDALEPEKSRDIDLRTFVPRESLDPIHFQRAYYLVPGGDSVKAYRLLSATMEETRKAGIATFVMRGKEYLVAILSEGGLLRAETLRYEDEIRRIEQVGAPDGESEGALRKKFVAAVRKKKEKALDDEYLENREIENLQELAEKKLESGEGVVDLGEAGETPADEGEVIDLMEALRMSLGKEASGEGPKKRRSAKAASSDLSAMTRDELYALARKRDLSGRSSMSKKELIEALG